MRKFSAILLGILFILSSCSPRITTKLTKSYPALDYKEDVKVYGLEDPLPGKIEVLGTVRIGDTGFTTNCDLNTVTEAAKLEARKIGGNAIKIIDHIPPSAMGSSCHQIVAKIVKVTDFQSIATMSHADSVLMKADYALLHFYRFSGLGPIISYDMHLGDTVICRVKNNWKQTVRIKKDGLNTLWAKTESKEELPINIKMGKEYYIRCSVTTGILIGRPKLVMVSKDMGEIEYPEIQSDEKKGASTNNNQIENTY